MPRLVRPDDDVVRYESKWLGPDEFTLPFHARYVAWGLWFFLWIGLSVVLLILPGFDVAQDLLWAFTCSVILTVLVMLAVDNDNPLSAFLPTLRAELSALQRPEVEQQFQVSIGTVRIRTLALTTTSENP